jgi:taurine dioxygenase
LDATTLSEIRSAFLEHHVLVFRRQKLSPADLESFSEAAFGPVLAHPIFPAADGTRGTVRIENIGKRLSTNEHWHSDVTFVERPPVATLLHAVEVPACGGDTQFANQHLAYEALSPGMQQMLDGMCAVHTGQSLRPRTGSGLAQAVAQNAAEASESGARYRAVLHPVVQRHPETGRKCLFLCRAFVERLEGFALRESQPILEGLFARQVLPDLTYRHRWERGDLVVWDNRCLLHYAIHDHGNDERRLLRCTTGGSASFTGYAGIVVEGKRATRRARPRASQLGPFMPRDLVGYQNALGPDARL